MKLHSEEYFYCQICAAVNVHSLDYTKNNIPLFRCKRCGVGRAKIEGFEPEKYYTKEYFKDGCREAYIDYLGSEEVLRREFRQSVHYLRRKCPTYGKCLEIGCAYGFFLQEAKTFYDVYGVEISEDAARYCQENGLLNVRKGQLTKEFLLEIGTLDVVVMLDVIEHIDDLEKLIELISTFLKPGAIMLITTGDWSSLLARLMGSSWRLIAPPGHLWYLAPNSLDILMKRFGMMRIDISYPWKIVPFNLILKQLISMLGLQFKIHVPRSFRNCGIPANLFDSMRLVYKKSDD